jgi:outer membrane protein assembly factor BamB
LWSRRLNSTPRQLMAAEDQVLALDTTTDNGARVLVLDSTTGDLTFEIVPTCNEGGFGNRAHVSDQFLVTPDASALVVLGSGSYACAWRFDLADGATSWHYESRGIDPVLPFAWAFGSLAFGDPVAYFVDETEDPAQIWAMDTRAGEKPDAPIYSVDQYDLELLQTTGNLLLASAVPTYATEEVELWAIDRTSGERRWQRRLETTHTFDKWLVHPTADGIFVAVCRWNEDLCRFLVLDPETGVSRAETRHEFGGNLDGSVWLNARAYMTIDGALHVVDLDSAEIDYSWP